MDAASPKEGQQTGSSAKQGAAAMSVSTGSSSSANSSSGSLAAAKVWAKVLAAHDCATFVQKENELLIETGYLQV